MGLAEAKGARFVEGNNTLGTARKDQLSVARQAADWNDTEQTAFMFDFSQRVFDLFGVPRPRPGVVEGILTAS